MSFIFINANDVPRIATFPDTVDMRMRAVLCEIDMDLSMLVVSLIHPETKDYVVRVFALLHDPSSEKRAAVLVGERTGFNNYVQAKSHGRAVARFWHSKMVSPGGPTPGEDVTFPIESLLIPFTEQEDFFPSGMELSVERSSKQELAVFMAGVKPEMHRFPVAVKNATLALPAWLAVAVRNVNQRQATTNKPGRPLKVGDLLICNSDDIPMFAGLWILNMHEGKLLPHPLDPTFDIGAWCMVPIADHRKGMVHCFEQKLYAVTGKFTSFA